MRVAWPRSGRCRVPPFARVTFTDVVAAPAALRRGGLAVSRYDPARRLPDAGSDDGVGQATKSGKSSRNDGQATSSSRHGVFVFEENFASTMSRDWSKYTR